MPKGANWLHEVKYDGYRIIARKAGDDVTLFSRSGLDWTVRFPAIAQAMLSLPCESTLIDGEVAFRPDDPDLGGRVILHWAPFDWVEEDEPVIGHPHDPFKRIDCLRSSRHVRVEVDGLTVAESSRPTMLIETGLPVRWYLPREDVRTDLLTASETTSHCPFKGDATYFSAPGAKDAFWVYEEPSEEDAQPIARLLAPWPGRVEVTAEAA